MKKKSKDDEKRYAFGELGRAYWDHGRVPMNQEDIQCVDCRNTAAYMAGMLNGLHFEEDENE